MPWLVILAQAPTPQPAPTGGANAATIFYLTLLFIFLTAIVTAIVTKWSRDKCLKFFHQYHVTLERGRGQTIWGMLKVFSSGVEIMYDHPFADHLGRRKTSYMIYQQELDQQLLSVLRYHDELSPQNQENRRRQVQRTFNPGPLRRSWRSVRNFVNTLRDAFNAAIGAAVGQYQRMNPASAVVATQAGQVTQIGQTLLGRFANAYEPLLEQYIGQPVILDVADPINPNNAIVEYTGFLADYTQNFIAIFNVNHKSGDGLRVELPDVEMGEKLPPLPAPPPPGAGPPVLPEPIKTEHNLAIRIDGARFRIQNTSPLAIVARRLEREGYEPVELGAVIAPSATLDLPARDARGGVLVVEVARCLDVVAPRKVATVRHAGVLLDRKTIVSELNIDQLPLVPKLLRGEEKQQRREAEARDPVAPR
jgi:hypothetical protein